MRVSRISLGTATFGVGALAESAHEVVAAALDVGINFFDTANVYGALSVFDQPGAPRDREPAESILGRALDGRRDDIVIATKSGERRLGPDAGLSRRHIIQQVEISLRRLQTDYIDVYYAHFPDPVTSLEQTLQAYDDLIREGKVRYVALSNFPAWQITQALWISDDRRLQAPVAAQAKYSLVDRSAEVELVPACAEFGLSIVAYSPLHGGLLAGSRVLDREVSGWKRFGGPEFSDAELKVGRAVEALSGEWGLAANEVSLAWLLSRRAVTAAIIGAESAAEVVANAAAADLTLMPDQLDALTALAAESPVPE